MLPGKQVYLCSINDFWASRLKFLARTNYLPLNERLFKINLREIVLSGSRVFRATALSKAAVLDRRLLSHFKD